MVKRNAFSVVHLNVKGPLGIIKLKTKPKQKPHNYLENREIRVLFETDIQLRMGPRENKGKYQKIN